MANSSRPTQIFLIRKVLSSIVTLFVLSAIVFLMVKLIPGDEAHVAAGENATAAQVEAARVRLGLDQSLPVQYVKFLQRLIHGDLGTSITSHQSIRSGIGQVLPQTIELVVLALIMMVTVVLPLAIISSMHRTGRADTATRIGVVIIAALPTFWLALVLQNLLGAQLKLLPISGRLTRGIAVPRRTGSVLLDSILDGNPNALWNALQHLVLPAAVLCLPFAAQLYRTLRTELIRALARDHLTVARAKGVPMRRLVMRHALPNAMGPAITVLGVQFGAMAGAAVLVESVFGLVGIGSYLTNAVAQKDTFAVLGGVLVIGVLVVVTSFVVDVLQLIRDPRIRAGQLGA
jgi:ABC-type dipeptide/oligopeptide/nickel transport system permease component